MKKIQNAEIETVVMLVVVQNLGVRRIIPKSKNIMGRRVCDENKKTDLEVQDVVDKLIFKKLKLYHQHQQHVVPKSLKLRWIHLHHYL